MGAEPARAHEARVALAARLATVSEAAGIEVPAGDDAATDAAAMLLGLVDRLANDPQPEAAWVLLVAVTGAYPVADEVSELVRDVTTTPADRVAERLVERAFAADSVGVDTRLEMVSDGVIADVEVSAKSAHNTGIQRVVRNIAPALSRHPEVIFAVWSSGHRGLRRLTPLEDQQLRKSSTPHPGECADEQTILVPVGSVLLLAEVPSNDASVRLAALAEKTTSRIVAIGYDAIPVTSRETVNRREAVKFSKYLTVIKWSHAVAAISGAAAAEFRGFGNMLSSQGLPGPAVHTCSLPGGTPRERQVSESDIPMIAVVGSKEPRKNHVAVLYAAERLWRAGLRFELTFVGSYGWDTRLFRAWLGRLQKSGRPITANRHTSDQELADVYARARFTVFPSLHEGYGLPVVESLAYGTPVITTGYGSTGEIAADGGCVTIDPRDDDALMQAMRSLLQDDDALRRLQEEARRRPTKTWDDYAEELWAIVTDAL
ncbi:glycosyltransferase [Diaminobutyricimonas sp. TR449]|uniref:glycosyltransferase n=1 Tax=Diaminobutyricimonas sp. TR449 TaxID=2708076 RepID=UPI0014245923|nr:glycosyltransferase [Diaminobutyricimonas sp. TR449]